MADGLRVYIQVMQPTASGTVQFDVAGRTYAITYGSPSAWQFAYRQNRGWTATRAIPWDELGGRPDSGVTWPLQIAYSGAAWTGTLRWGLPDYAGRDVAGASVLALPVTADAGLGGGTDCGADDDPNNGRVGSFFDAWGSDNSGYFGSNVVSLGAIPYANVQNQWDTADWPCYSKYVAKWRIAGLPAGAQVVSAALDLYKFGHSGYAGEPTGVNVIQVFDASPEWDEATVSWDNPPTVWENVSRLPVGECAVSACNPGEWHSFDVTEIVRRALLRGDSDAAALLYTAAGQYHSGRYFYTREGGNPPTVRIAYTIGQGEPTWTATPTPSSTPLSGLPTPSPTWTASATMTPVSATATPTPTLSPSATAQPSPSPSASPTLAPVTPQPPTPTIAPTIATSTPISSDLLRGVAVLGDSFFDEYRGTDNRGGAYAATTLNLIELLQRYRGFNLGAWGTWGEPRRTGYEYNWARSGATSSTLIQQNQHVKAAAQIAAGQVTFVFIGIGANDFSPYSGPHYADIYNGALTGTALDAKVNKAVADVTLAVRTVQDAGAQGVAVTLFTDWNLDPQVQRNYPDATKRARVGGAIGRVNAGIRSMAAARGVAVVDQNAIGNLLLPGLDSGGNLTVGGQKIAFLTNGNEPRFAKLADGQHIGTVLGGLMANYYIIDTLNAAFGQNIPRLTDAEILAAAGLAAGPQPGATPTATPTATPQATGTPVAQATEPPVVVLGCTRTIGPADSMATAVAALRPGDTLCLRDGLYRQSIVAVRNGQPGKPITVRALNDGQVTIDGQGQRRPVQLGSNNQAIGDWHVIEGIVFRNGTDAVLHVRADNNVFRRVSVYDANTDVNSQPLLLWGSNNTVEDCLVGGTGRFMVDVYGGGGVDARGNTVRRCFVKWSGWDGRRFCGVTWPNGFMMGAYNSSGGTFENNIIYGKGVMGLIVQANTSSASANNNAVLGNLVLGMGKERAGGTWQLWDYRYAGGAYPNRPGPTDDPYDDTNCDDAVTPWTWPGQRSGLKFFGQGTLQGNIFRDNLAADNAGLGFHYSNPGGGRYTNNVIDRLTLLGNGSDASRDDGGKGAQAVFPPGAPCTDCRIGDAGAGGAILQRYVDRVATGQPLTPWPMEGRAMAELGLSINAIWQEYAGR